MSAPARGGRDAGGRDGFRRETAGAGTAAAQGEVAEAGSAAAQGEAAEAGAAVAQGGGGSRRGGGQGERRLEVKRRSQQAKAW